MSGNWFLSTMNCKFTTVHNINLIFVYFLFEFFDYLLLDYLSILDGGASVYKATPSP